MSRVTDEERHARRVASVAAWLDVIEEAARELELEVLSRPAETASQAGVDPDPRLRPCEHRPAWMRGRLCLACENTGLRPATEQERREGLAHDPYLLDPPRSGHAVKRDTSEAARKTMEAERLDAIIASLQRDARLRAGVEVREGALRSVRMMRGFELSLGPTGRRVLRALYTLGEDLRRACLSRDERALTQLAAAVPGRLRTP